MTETIVNLSLPRFNTGSTSKLNDVLDAMGIDCNYTTLSKMGIDKQVVYNIVQKTSNSVNEDGAVAAAATSNTMCTSPGESVEYDRITLTFNRPFMFFIVNDKTGAILMAGRICNL